MKVGKKLWGLLRKRGQIVVLDVLLALLALLAFIGLYVLASERMTFLDYLEGFGPLALGIVSIVVAFVTLHINLSANREQVQRDRDLQVRPVVVMRFIKGTAIDKHRDKHHAKIEATDDTLKTEEMRRYLRWALIENIGMGPAQHIEFVLEGKERFLLATGDVDTLRPGQQAIVSMRLMLGEGFTPQFYSKFFDVYGSEHYCRHSVWINDDSDYYVIQNRYVEKNSYFLNSAPCKEFQRYYAI